MEGRKEGGKEGGREERRKEGREGGREGGRKDGRKEGRKEGGAITALSANWGLRAHSGDKVTLTEPRTLMCHITTFSLLILERRQLCHHQ